jgi:cardiolipin synthase (CMP-forming)
VAERPPGPRRLTRKRLFGIDRSGPEPLQTRAGQPLRPFTWPNLVGYVRLAAIPVFLVIALNSDDGRDPVAWLLFLGIALGDALDGFVARATGQYSRLGALLDPIVDRLTVLSGAVVCWHFTLLPRWALAALAIREVVTLLLARAGMRRGVDLEITWVGRVAVFLVMASIFGAMVVDSVLVRIAFITGLLAATAATVLYVRAARATLADRERRAARIPPP